MPASSVHAHGEHLGEARRPGRIALLRAARRARPPTQRQRRRSVARWRGTSRRCARWPATTPRRLADAQRRSDRVGAPGQLRRRDAGRRRSARIRRGARGLPAGAAAAPKAGLPAGSPAITGARQSAATTWPRPTEEKARLRRAAPGRGHGRRGTGAAHSPHWQRAGSWLEEERAGVPARAQRLLQAGSCGWPRSNAARRCVAVCERQRGGRAVRALLRPRPVLAPRDRAARGDDRGVREGRAQARLWSRAGDLAAGRRRGLVSWPEQRSSLPDASRKPGMTAFDLLNTCAPETSHRRSPCS